MCSLVPFRFADFELSPENRLLTKTGQSVALTPKAFQLLELLLRRRPAVVSKQEIQDVLWPDTYVLEAELPGVKREDVNIEVVGNELAITGEIKERERKGALRKRTRRTGQFKYRVRLPEQVDSTKIDAKLDQGVLTVRVPKAERAQRRKIEIKS